MTKHTLPALIAALAATTADVANAQMGHVTPVATTSEHPNSNGDQINSIDCDRLLRPGCPKWHKTSDDSGVYTSDAMENGPPPSYEVGDA